MSLIKFKIIKFENTLIYQSISFHPKIKELVCGINGPQYAGAYGIDKNGDMCELDSADMAFVVNVGGYLEFGRDYIYLGHQEGSIVMKSFLSNEERDRIFKLIIFGAKALTGYFDIVD